MYIFFGINDKSIRPGEYSSCCFALLSRRKKADNLHIQKKLTSKVENC